MLVAVLQNQNLGKETIMAAIDDLKQVAIDLGAAIDAEGTVLKGIEDKLAAAIAAGNQDPAIAAVVADLQASRQRSADATAAASAILNPNPAPPAAPVVPTTVQEVHDAVQAGAITPQQAVDAGVIKSVDQIAPAPVPAVDPTTSAPAAPVAVPVSSVPSGG